MSSNTRASNGSNTSNSTVVAPASAGQPNAAKGANQGQTTLAATLSRWEVMANNLAKGTLDVSKVQDLLDPFAAVVQEARVLRDELKLLEAQGGVRMARRNDILTRGGELYSLLRLRLKSHLGQKSEQLTAFGLKIKRKTGPKKKSPVPVPVPEVKATQPAPAPVAARADAAK